MFERQTQYQNNEDTFSTVVRVGIVTAVDSERRLAQVYFRDMDLPSGWIPVLINRDIAPQTEYEEGGEGMAAFERHKHDLTIRPWMPKVNEQVLCLYEPIRDGRGFVLGGIQTWQT